MKKKRKASDIYKRQNTLLHKAFSAAGMPYQQHREVWLNLATELADRQVAGLSEMSLSERHKLLLHFQGKGQKIFAPGVPANVRDWKKGDPDTEHEFREEDDPQVRMVYAMWAEMGYRQKTLRGLCFKLFGRDDPRWLDHRQLSRLVNVVKAKAESKGGGKYYRRKA